MLIKTTSDPKNKYAYAAIGGALLLLTGLAELLIDRQTAFMMERLPLFEAWYGLGCCIVMVIVVRMIGFLLLRPARYYQEHKG